MKRLVMTDEMIRYIEENIYTKSVSEIAKDLGTGYMNVYREAERLNVPRRGQHKFTDEDDSFIRKWYGVMRAGEISRRLDCSRSAVYYRAGVLGLTGG